MKDNTIDISGMAQAEEFPKVSRNYPFSEMCETYNFHIPQNKPNINKIIKLFIDASVKNIKTVDVPWGKRTIVEGMLHIKVFYSSDVYSKKIYYVHIDVPIYTFLALERKVDIGILIEDAVIHKLDSRNISISCLLFLYPKLEEVDFHEDYTTDGDGNDLDKYKDEEEYIEKEEWNSIDNYKVESDTNMNFYSTDELEFNIEYDMNSYSLDDEYCEDKKKDCDCE